MQHELPEPKQTEVHPLTQQSSKVGAWPLGRVMFDLTVAGAGQTADVQAVCRTISSSICQLLVGWSAAWHARMGTAACAR